MMNFIGLALYEKAFILIFGTKKEKKEKKGGMGRDSWLVMFWFRVSGDSF